MNRKCMNALLSGLLEVNFVNFHVFNNKHFFFARSLALRHMIVMEKSDCLCTHRLSVAITQQSCQREKCHKSLNNVSPSLNRRKIASQQISHKNNTKRISTN